MKQYTQLLEKIMRDGVDRNGRNGLTRSLFAQQCRFNLQKGFPATTTKKLAFRSVAGELIWFLEGSSDDNRLKEIMSKNTTIWTANAEAPYWKPKSAFDGDLGRIYGVQWRSWKTPDGKIIDQLGSVIEKIKKDPCDRRLVISAWNPGEIDQMALPPCHMLFQFYVAKPNISLHMVQRSCDMFLGVPFNIASYSLLLEMVAHVTGLTAHECIITFNDAHIYHEHFDAIKEQLSRDIFPLPKLWLNPEIKNIDEFALEDIKLVDYQSHPTIKAKMII